MTKGRKPINPHLRLIEGTHREDRHGDAGEAQAKVKAMVGAFGKLELPSYLKGHARVAWKRYIEPAAWLDGSRAPAAVAFCELWAEFRFAPTNFTAARHSQMRAYAATLGLSDARQRAIAEPVEEDEFFK